METVKKKAIFQFGGAALVLMLLAGCGGSGDLPLTQTATLPATPTRTVRPTRTMRPTPMKTWTPAATLPPDQAQSLLAELVETNGGCAYPCWWGIVPGETTWVSAREFLQPIASETNISRKGNSYGLIFPNQQEDSAVFKVDDGVVSLIQTRNGKTIFDMLEEFGKPDQIWIKALDGGVPLYALYDIVLFYSEKGIMAIYDGATTDSENETIIDVCLQDTTREPYFPVWLWSPENNVTFKELESRYFVDPLSSPSAYFLTLEESTDLDVDRFYEIFSDPAKRSTCFDAIDRSLITPEPTP